VGGVVAKKKFDPLWELVDEKIALQGQEPDVDVPCPHCHVIVHLGASAEAGQRVTCGLCGGLSTVVESEQGPRLDPAGQ
jgi:hypothetical protein